MNRREFAVGSVAVAAVAAIPFVANVSSSKQIWELAWQLENELAFLRNAKHIVDYKISKIEWNNGDPLAHVHIEWEKGEPLTYRMGRRTVAHMVERRPNLEV